MRNKLNSKAAFFAVILLFSLVFSCKKDEVYEMSADDISLAEVLVKSKLVVGVNTHNPPMCFFNNKQELVGFDVDVFKELADKMNIEVEFFHIDVSTMFDLINDGTIDCIALGLSYSEERSKVLELTKPYLRNVVVILSLQSKDLKTIEDLEGKKIGGEKKSLSISLLKNNPDIMSRVSEVKESYNNIPEVLSDLKNYGIDACVGDITTLALYLKTEPNVYTLFEQAIALDSYVYAFKKGNLALKKEVEQNLLEMEERGIFEKISRKWFGINLVIFGK